MFLLPSTPVVIKILASVVILIVSAVAFLQFCLYSSSIEWYSFYYGLLQYWAVSISLQSSSIKVGRGGTGSTNMKSIEVIGMPSLDAQVLWHALNYSAKYWSWILPVWYISLTSKQTPRNVTNTFQNNLWYSKMKKVGEELVTQENVLPLF